MRRVHRRRRVQSQRRRDLDYRPGVKLYRVLLTQTGIIAPSVIVLDNTLGVIVWTRASSGSYIGTLAGAFPSGKTAIFCGSSNDVTVLAGAKRVDANTVRVSTIGIDGTPTDDELNQTAIEILIYP